MVDPARAGNSKSRHAHPGDDMNNDRCKIVGQGGVELVQLSMEENRITIRTAPSSSFMTQPVGGAEAPIVMPREHAEALAFILRNSSIREFQAAKVIRVD